MTTGILTMKMTGTGGKTENRKLPPPPPPRTLTEEHKSSLLGQAVPRSSLSEMEYELWFSQSPHWWQFSCVQYNLVVAFASDIGCDLPVLGSPYL